MAENQVDLTQLFSAVSGVLANKQAALNEADTYNHDHGDHIVEIFNVITKAVQKKSAATPAEQLAFASRQLEASSQSGSAQLYAQNLKTASEQFKDKLLTPENAMLLVQLLLGASQTSAGSDLLGKLLSGGKAADGQQAKVDTSDLLAAGMAFLQAKQRGGTTTESLVEALVTGSQMGASSHRAESGKLIANTLMQVIASMANK